MRPTVEEQLEGTCRLLEQVIAPELATSHAAQVLSGLVRNLRMLESSWSQVLPFLHWDNEATVALLETAHAVVSAPLAARLADLPGPGNAEPLDPLDVTVIQRRNDELRQLLSDVVIELSPARGPEAAAAHSDIVAHFKTRARRYPMRMIPELSQPTAAKDS